MTIKELYEQANPVLKKGEIVIIPCNDACRGNDVNYVKIGDGVTAFNDLEYGVTGSAGSNSGVSYELNLVELYTGSPRKNGGGQNTSTTYLPTPSSLVTNIRSAGGVACIEADGVKYYDFAYLETGTSIDITIVDKSLSTNDAMVVTLGNSQCSVSVQGKFTIPNEIKIHTCTNGKIPRVLFNADLITQKAIDNYHSKPSIKITATATDSGFTFSCSGRGWTYSAWEYELKNYAMAPYITLTVAGAYYFYNGQVGLDSVNERIVFTFNACFNNQGTDVPVVVNVILPKTGTARMIAYALNGQIVEGF